MRLDKKPCFWTRLTFLALLVVYSNHATAYQLSNSSRGASLDAGVTQGAINQLNVTEETANGFRDWTGPSFLQMPTVDSESFWEALINGKIDLNNRFRIEDVRMNGVRNALAVTNRMQLGYGTNSYHGFSGYIDFVNVHPFDYDRYNAAGLNNQPDRAIIADPRLTLLNQLYGQFKQKQIEGLIRIGRQRMIHQDARFVGNVGWRQNEQTYDALLASSSLGIEGLTIQYNYIWQVNRIFGPDHPVGVFDSDSHMGFVSYENLPVVGTITGFLYLLEFENAQTLSANTAGFRAHGNFDLTDNLLINYLGSYAWQKNAGMNPKKFEVNYYRLDLNLERQAQGRLGVTYEVLGSDNGEAAFQTPLATLHAWQGWADVFLSTPPLGINDVSLYIGINLPWKINTRVQYHWFYENEFTDLYGEEYDISIQKQINKYWNVLLKFTDFQGHEPYADRRKFWIQTEIRF